MIQRRLHEITLDDIRSLIDNAVHEGRTIDYKLNLPGNADKERKEFLADVISFANAGGGDLIYGVRERSDENGKNTGLPEAIEGAEAPNQDDLRLRLDNLIRDGIEPRIQGVDYKFLALNADRHAVVLRVPKSWAAPHQRIFAPGGVSASAFWTKDHAP